MAGWAPTAGLDPRLWCGVEVETETLYSKSGYPRAHTHTKLQPSTTPPVREMALLDDLTGLDAEQCGGGNFHNKSCQF